MRLSLRSAMRSYHHRWGTPLRMSQLALLASLQNMMPSLVASCKFFCWATSGFVWPLTWLASITLFQLHTARLVFSRTLQSPYPSHTAPASLLPCRECWGGESGNGVFCKQQSNETTTQNTLPYVSIFAILHAQDLPSTTWKATAPCRKRSL